MVKKLATLLFLVLAASPYTAPFRTCDPVHSEAIHDVDTLIAALHDENDPGSLIAPLVTETGRLKILPTAGIVVVSHFVAEPHISFITGSIPPTDGVADSSIRSTILRL
jgi:hypothetical protein